MHLDICYGRKSNNLIVWISHTNAADLTSDQLMQAIWTDIWTLTLEKKLVSMIYFAVLLTPYWADSSCLARSRRSSCRVRCKPSSISQVTSCRRPTGTYFSLSSTKCAYFEIILLYTQISVSGVSEGEEKRGRAGREIDKNFLLGLDHSAPQQGHCIHQFCFLNHPPLSTKSLIVHIVKFSWLLFWNWFF